MRKIGVDKRDPSFRHFYYDDDKLLNSNPPKYEVHYIDEDGDVDYIECSSVIKIKDAPLENQSQEIVNESIITDITPKPLEVPDTSIQSKSAEPKRRGRKKKVTDDKKDITISSKEAELITIQSSTIKSDIKFEYKVFSTEFSNPDELVNTLNECGDLGWELCNSEIYSEGIFEKKKIFCILKRIKGLV